MFNKYITKKVVLTTIIMMFFVMPTGVLFAKTVLYDGAPKDRDFDGLTDQGEIQIFGTNPNNPDTDRDGYLDSAEVLSGTNPHDPNDPMEGIERSILPYENSNIPWAWYFIRSSGLTAYMLLFLLIVSGIGIKTSLSYKIISPSNAWATHRLLGISLSVMISTHLVSLLFDEFLKFSFADILIPFVADFKSIYVGLGIIGFYLFLGIIITSLFCFNKTPRLWRLLHYLTYPTFILLLLHGIYTGTDTSLGFVQLMYLITGLIVLILTSYRISLKIIK